MEARGRVVTAGVVAKAEEWVAAMADLRVAARAAGWEEARAAARMAARVAVRVAVVRVAMEAVAMEAAAMVPHKLEFQRQTPQRPH